MNEDYCSYEISKALKACGFDEPCEAFYLPPMKNRPEPFFSGRVKRSIKNETHAFHLSAPSLYHAQKWLREKHKWHIVIEPRIWEQQVYDYKLWSFMRGYENANRGLDYLSYEQALSAGISAALELIKKGE